ncbi:MAG TPA: FAD/NAD(P)-binding oxidoreductase [Acidimicrobiia bacterium]|nr:FAD/NAD(P)-binding oxidoreductase [Acidimicrobiia bacterium]
MKKLVVLGAGLAGTMAVNRLRPHLDPAEWDITIVDQDETHIYQPGLLFIPFGMYRPADVVRPRRDFIPAGVRLIVAPIELVDPARQRVTLSGGHELEYDHLIIATGTAPRPEQTTGLLGDAWRDTVHDFYTLEGATALAQRLEGFNGGRIVIDVMELPFKCPVAPLEFAFLMDWWLQERGLRDRSEVIYTTPLSGAFTKPVSSRRLGHLLEDKKIALETDFYTERVDADRGAVVSYDGREVAYDLLVTIPVNMGADFVGRSGLGDELNHIPVDRATFATEAHPNVFAIGDAAELGTSKAGSVAHFASEVFTANFLRGIRGLAPLETFDGHANCFIESGFGKAMLIDFNYTTEPLPGKFPLPGIGPFTLLEETEMNHWGKLMFRWTYWNILLRGKDLPLPGRMLLAGKESA